MCQITGAAQLLTALRGALGCMTSALAYKPRFSCAAFQFSQLLTGCCVQQFGQDVAEPHCDVIAEDGLAYLHKK